MTILQEDIREKILDNNSKIEELLIKESFILKEDIFELVKENEKLRSLCTEHKYDGNGICEYCFSRAEKKEN